MLINMLIAPFAEDGMRMIARAIPRFASQRGQHKMCKGGRLIIDLSCCTSRNSYRYLLCQLAVEKNRSTWYKKVPLVRCGVFYRSAVRLDDEKGRITDMAR